MNIRILGVDYPLEYTNEVQKLNGDNLGLMDGITHTIYIREESSNQIGTILHEIVESIDCRLELKLEHPQISSLDAALTQVLLDNPDLLKLILKAAKR